MKRVPKAKKQVPSKKKLKPPKKTHAWRLCSVGEHWVRTHNLKVPPSRKDPNGSITTRHGHCAKNPTGKDQLYRDEIQEIASKNFSRLQERPCPDDLGFRGRHKGNEYDGLIAGWTKYWNDVFKPSTPLDPDIVKALVASESGFDPGTLANKKNKNSARGLLQITNDTRKILGDEKGELKDHYLTLTREDLNDPNLNICAGIRWLFRKAEIASNLLGRQATWEEAVFEFKGIRTTKKSNPKKIIKAFYDYLEVLKKCGNK
jgi:hypothetical protein